MGYTVNWDWMISSKLLLNLVYMIWDWMIRSGLLTHWGRVTHICIGNLAIIGSDNGLSPSRRQAIIWANAGILWFGPLRTNFSEISIEINIFSFKKMQSKKGKGYLFPLGLNVLMFPVWQLSIFIGERSISNEANEAMALVIVRLKHWLCYIGT